LTLAQCEPSEEYRRWERDILATEELILEALCFDTRVEQPWPLLRHATKGFDGLRLASLSADGQFGMGFESVNGGGDDGNADSGAAESSAQAAARESASGQYPNGVNGNGNGHAEAGSANGKGKERASRLTEGVLLETAWVILSES
jgi:hypothetical protein